MTTVINKTPHALNIVNAAGETVTIAPSLPAARVDTVRVEGEPIAGFTTQTVSMGAVIDLPDPANDTIYIVSAIVLQQVPNRPDVFAPGELVRDAEGRVIGAKGLTRNSAPNADAAKKQIELYVYDGHDASQAAKDLAAQRVEYALNDRNRHERWAQAARDMGFYPEGSPEWDDAHQRLFENAPTVKWLP